MVAEAATSCHDRGALSQCGDPAGEGFECYRHLITTVTNYTESKLPSSGGMVSIIWGGAMPSRKLPLALCVAQTAATAILTFWADRMEWLRGDSNRIPPHFVKLHLAVLDLREAWRGINA